MPQTHNDKLNAFLTKAKAFFKEAALKVWAYMRLAKIELIVLFSALFLDLLTKFIIDRTMVLGQVSQIIPNFLNFRYVLNEEAAFGQSFGLMELIGAGGVRVVFICITTIALCGFCFFLYHLRGKSLFARVSLALVIAGALGNFYDRIFIGAVRDFVEIVFFGLDLPILGETFAIFNVADAELVVGVIAFSIFFVFKYKSPSEELVGPVFKPDFVLTCDLEQAEKRDENDVAKTN